MTFKKFLKCCPSERLNEPKISRIINDSVANGVEHVSSSSNPNRNKSSKETIDFLHFIRYMNIIYKSDINLRLKFLYGICIKDTDRKIEIYNNIFSILNTKFEIHKKRMEMIKKQKAEEAENERSSFKSYIETTEASNETIELSSIKEEQQLMNKELPIPSMNQVKQLLLVDLFGELTNLCFRTSS